MTYKAESASYGPDKKYLWNMANYGNGVSLWGYVTADAVATVAMSDYFTAADSDLGDGDSNTKKMKPGDLLFVWQVGSIDDSRTIQEDINTQLVDTSLHVVLSAADGVVNVSEDLLSATVTYTS